MQRIKKIIVSLMTIGRVPSAEIRAAWERIGTDKQTSYDIGLLGTVIAAVAAYADDEEAKARKK